MTRGKKITLFKLYHFTFLGLLVLGAVCIFFVSFPIAIICLTGLAFIILDLCMSSASTSEKVAWSLVLLLLQFFVLPFYWYAFLRNGRNSWFLEKLSKLAEPGDAENSGQSHDLGV